MRCLWRCARTRSVTTRPMPRLFMYSSPVKLSTRFRKCSPPALAYACIKLSSHADVRSPLISITPVIPSRVRVSMVVTCATLDSLPGSFLVLRCRGFVGQSSHFIGIDGHEFRQTSDLEDLPIVFAQATRRQHTVLVARTHQDSNYQRNACAVD